MEGIRRQKADEGMWGVYKEVRLLKMIEMADA